MAQVTSQIFLQAVDDGSSLHGVLLTTLPLVQIYTNGTTNPDWTDSTKQPTIYLSLKNGVTDVSTAVSGVKWTYNGTIIQFNGTTHLSTNIKPGVFMETTYNGAPALKVVGNLAVSDLVDTDVIGFECTYTNDGAAIGITLYANIKLASVAPGSYRGVVLPATKSGSTYLEGGTTIIDKENTDIYLFARLYNEEGEVTGQNSFTTQWYVGTTPITPTNITIGGKTYPSIHLTEANVDDYAIVEVEFYVDNKKVNSAYIEVDDQQDDMMLYVSSIINRNGSTLQPETSESGEGGTIFFYNTDTATLKLRMGKQTDPSVTLSQFKYFYIKFVEDVNDLDNTTYISALDGINNPVSTSDASPAYGWRPLAGEGTQSYGTVNISYANLATMGRKMTAFLMARDSALTA